jgi:hypothetical protein
MKDPWPSVSLKAKLELHNLLSRRRLCNLMSVTFETPCFRLILDVFLPFPVIVYIDIVSDRIDGFVGLVLQSMPVLSNRRGPL